VKHIFIIGSKGLPARHGGFETFVENLTAKKKNENIHYHISCLNSVEKNFEYNGADCFGINVPNWFGDAKAVIYDILALNKSIEFIKQNNIQNAVIYLLASRIGLFISLFKKRLQKIGIKLLVNPDGLEFKRMKYSALIRRYWKVSEKYSVKNVDLVICDSKEIQKYIENEYAKFKPKTKFIAYGADLAASQISDDDSELQNWYSKNNIKPGEFYLIVGRNIPENNFETIISEFDKSNSQKKLIIISNIKQQFKGKAIFSGTLYNQKMLKKIREQAFAYIHGHEVGGTNPSLLEALASTKLNLLLDVCFNKEVAGNAALYWTKEKDNLAKLIDNAEKMQEQEIENFEKLAKGRIESEYSWEKIVGEYENMWGKQEGV
jgi:rhamnosyltransferase